MKQAPQDALERVTGDGGLVCSVRDTAKRAAAAGLDVFVYNSTRPIPIPALAGLDLRATHGAEIAYVFGSVGADVIGEEDLALSATMPNATGEGSRPTATPMAAPISPGRCSRRTTTSGSTST